MRPDPQTRALWEMFSELMDLDDAHRYVADMLAGMDVRYGLGDDHRLVGSLCPDMKLTSARPDPDFVTAVTRSGDLLREGRRPHGPVDVDALLIRPGGCVAWDLPTGQDLDAITLVRAPGAWFGQPV
ncbi:hypothetical protein [Streptomyces sp. NPDC058694]|uniref:aromatic-ring hydroxylase C-terminal domain-containing protein n=1 Tax=Streptomyces sp. NPDC058694 TaxID=3346603 RepID=UPI0036572CE2